MVGGAELATFIVPGMPPIPAGGVGGGENFRHGGTVFSAVAAQDFKRALGVHGIEVAGAVTPGASFTGSLQDLSVSMPPGECTMPALSTAALGVQQFLGAAQLAGAPSAAA